MNTLYYGDNLDILRRYIKDESVDLVYLDPPFNSNASYNVLFKSAQAKVRRRRSRHLRTRGTGARTPSGPSTRLSSGRLKRSSR